MLSPHQLSTLFSLRYGHGEIEPDPSEYVNESGSHAWRVVQKERSRKESTQQTMDRDDLARQIQKIPDTYRWREYTGW